MEKIPNFRDFGGYKTQNGLTIKQGLLFRSGDLANASDNDLKKLSPLGIKTIIDLRTKKEKKNKPDRLPDNSGIKSIHIPIKVTLHDESPFIWQLLSLLFGKARNLDYGQAMKQVYQEYVTDFGSEFSEIIRLASEVRNLPLLIHCAGGKDRTGFAGGLIQLVLGVPVEAVIDDYLKSNDYLNDARDEFYDRLNKLSFFGVSSAKFAPIFEARREYLEAAFDQISHDFGSVDDYVREGLGCSDDFMLSLKALLLNQS